MPKFYLVNFRHVAAYQLKASSRNLNFSIHFFVVNCVSLT